MQHNQPRRGEYKKLDQELETGWKKGMISWERSIGMRSTEGWNVPQQEKSGYSEDEVEAFMAEHGR